MKNILVVFTVLFTANTVFAECRSQECFERKRMQGYVNQITNSIDRLRSNETYNPIQYDLMGRQLQPLDWRYKRNDGSGKVYGGSGSGFGGPALLWY